MTYWAGQCADHHGPRLPPDIFDGVDHASRSPEERSEKYNDLLALANSARVGGRHYAVGCLHSTIPGECWLIDPDVMPFVDLVVDIAPSGSSLHSKSVVMIRNVLENESRSRLRHLSKRTSLAACLDTITLHNSCLRGAAAVGTARANRGDHGTMHAIGTRVPFSGDEVMAYAANSRVTKSVLRNLVISLATVGVHACPDVLSVIQNTEGDTGLQPVSPMEGSGKGLRGGFSIDMSVNLGNASHVDVHDASQGFSVWTAERCGVATRWSFVLPNVHGGVRPDGTPYNGIAIRIRHGVALSWDGRQVRHCTSLSCPNGEGPFSEDNKPNYLYGTFTAAKDRIVALGRRLATAGGQRKIPPGVTDGVGDDGGNGEAIEEEYVIPKKKRV